MIRIRSPWRKNVEEWGIKDRYKGRDSEDRGVIWFIQSFISFVPPYNEMFGGEEKVRVFEKNVQIRGFL